MKVPMTAILFMFASVVFLFILVFVRGPLTQLISPVSPAAVTIGNNLAFAALPMGCV